jgi:hypothetical protein
MIIQALSIAGDLFWILALAVMSALSWAAQKRIPKGLSVPVAWRGEQVLVRAPKPAALWGTIVLGLVVGAWLQIESVNRGTTVDYAIIWLGVRATIAPLLATLHITQVRKGLETLGREGSL